MESKILKIVSSAGLALALSLSLSGCFASLNPPKAPKPPVVEVPKQTPTDQADQDGEPYSPGSPSSKNIEDQEKKNSMKKNDEENLDTGLERLIEKGGEAVNRGKDYVKEYGPPVLEKTKKGASELKDKFEKWAKSE